MLYWSLISFVITVLCAILGFSGIAAGATDLVRILFVIFLVMFVVSLIAGLMQRVELIE